MNTFSPSLSKRKNILKTISHSHSQWKGRIFLAGVLRKGERLNFLPSFKRYCMNNFEIKSKTYCPPSKRDKVLYISVNIAIIFVVMFSMVSMFAKGVSVGNVSGCIVAIAVGYRLKLNNRKEGHYEFCILSITFQENSLLVTFLPNKDKAIAIAIDSICSIEYSDKLECLRLICDYVEEIGIEKRKCKNSELLLYIPYDANSDFYQMLEKIVEPKLKFVDRQ